ncbi:septation ring formation regulator EzrA [Loigolactobacillus coryniformis]|uniref:septation ring formation regulator EzrA n=1 Tax=Loigolactobacillus coryniformis TaxID=1610 RepID=UPI0023416A91|nr:septation ring formation regulator EzrA [Loigolactobacillus coryniformis]MDC4185489.1 septation ring formation regulator EzrA [Loigolactobacillus coryniformis]
MELILIGIIILALVLYVGVIFYQRRNSKQIDALQDQEQKLTKLPFKKTMSAARQQGLAGQSQEEYAKWQERLQEIQKNGFADLERKLLLAETTNNRYRFFAAAKTIKELKQQLTTVQQALDEIMAGFGQIQADATANQTKAKELRELYQKLRKQLLTKSFSYGAAADGLEEKLSYLETSFDKYNRFTKSGDHVEGKAILGQLDKDITELNDLMKRIPPRFKELNNEFPEQLEELRQGYRRLADEAYQFYDIDIPAELTDLDQHINTTRKSLKKLDLTAIEATDQDIARRIDHLYDVMEAEIKAHEEVVSRYDELQAFINHAQKQNRELQDELDHLNQSYSLNNNEINQAQELKHQLDEIRTTFENDMQEVAGQTAVYSMVAENYSTVFAALTEIEKKQKAINDSVQGLRRGEEEAQRSLQSFEFEIRNVKRQVEKLNLPGLSRRYLDFFFIVADEITKLDQELNQVKIDLDVITKELITTQEDLNKLKEETNALIDSALLTEQLLQYANRYRHSHADVAQASDEALRLFNSEYDYKQAAETIATVLEQVEPGSYKKVEESFYKTKDQELKV